MWGATAPHIAALGDRWSEPTRLQRRGAAAGHREICDGEEAQSRGQGPRDEEYSQPPERGARSGAPWDAPAGKGYGTVHRRGQTFAAEEVRHRGSLARTHSQQAGYPVAIATGQPACSDDLPVFRQRQLAIG